jgi:hypothetical protein
MDSDHRAIVALAASLDAARRELAEAIAMVASAHEDLLNAKNWENEAAASVIVRDRMMRQFAIELERWNQPPVGGAGSDGGK